MDGQQKQQIIDLPKVIAGAIASPLAAILTSRFGVAGTMLGLALSAVIITVIVDTLKVYLSRVVVTLRSVPGGFEKKSAWGRFLFRKRLPYSKLSSLPQSRSRSLIVRGLIGGIIMFIIGLVVVTGAEMSVGKNLSCWVWENCSKESSTDGENVSDAGSLPSIFIASNRIGGGAPQVRLSVPKQQPTPRVSPPPPSSSSSSTNRVQPSVSEQTSARPSDQQSSPSAEDQQRSTYQTQGEYQQPSEFSQQDEYQESSTSAPVRERESLSSSEDAQPSNPSNRGDRPRQQDSSGIIPTPPAFLVRAW